MQYVFREPDEYSFKDRDGHDGKIFATGSAMSGHLIIECHDKLRVLQTENESEFNYYILKGEGYFIFNGERQEVVAGDLVVVPPGTQFSFGGQLRMLLTVTPPWKPEQEEKVAIG